MTEEASNGQRDDRAVSQFVERFSSVLVEAGWPRMPARAFVTLLASETGRLTAAELAERLQVSPAAISGAVRFMIQLDMVHRERVPGERRDVYRMGDDVWYDVIERRMQAVTRWEDQLREGMVAVGTGTEASHRLSDMVAFFTFLDEEFPAVMKRWHDHRRQLQESRNTTES